ncbi:MAG: UbiA family prenyltransferase [Candidatus Diapherotrites archaeon]|nr:UbiA family prenyltransferase [Candidatus Diapherotrites archaeon]
MHLKSFWELLRPLNCFMAGIAVIIGALLAGSIPSIEWIYAFISVFLICGAGQAINDFFDLEIDKKSHKERVLASGKIKPETALMYSMVLFFIGILIATLLNFTALMIALIFSVLLIAYSAFLEKLKYFGNLIVAAGTSFTLIFGATLTGNYSIVLILALSAFFTNYSRELIKDLEDLKADKGIKETLPMILGKQKTKLIIGASYGLAIGLSLSVFIEGMISSPVYLILILISAIVFILSQLNLIKGKLTESQSLSKKGMIIALIAFIAGALI